MELLNAIAIAAISVACLYSLMRRSLLKFVIGIALLSQAVNLLVFTSAGLTPAAPPIIEAGMTQPQGTIADPLPQALVLTAIVIGFGLLVFTLALSRRAIDAVGSDDLKQFKNTDT